MDCPTCKRTIWAGTACSHGQVPGHTKDEPKESAVRESPVYKPKTRHKR